MPKRSKRPPSFDISRILDKHVRVKQGEDMITMTPFEAEVMQCSVDALKGNIRACKKFINLCLRHGLIESMEPEEEYQSLIRIPKDWDETEFMALYNKFGPPPWRGPRDGLTSEERERRKGKVRR